MRLVEAALKVSDYTSAIDGKEFKDANKRYLAKAKEIQAFFAGLLTAYDYKKGQEVLLGTTEYKTYRKFYRIVIEIARRYKIQNPEKMRGEYGKFLYILQDCLVRIGCYHYLFILICFSHLISQPHIHSILFLYVIVIRNPILLKIYLSLIARHLSKQFIRS